VISNEFLKRWSQSQNIQIEFDFAKATNKKRFLIEDLILECKTANVCEFYSCTLCYVNNYSFNNSCYCVTATTCIQRVVNLETQIIQNISQLHLLWSELEIQHYDHQQLQKLAVSSEHKIHSLSLMLFVNEFNIYRNMY